MATVQSTALLKRELRKRMRTALSTKTPSSIVSESNQTVAHFTRSEVYKRASSIAMYASMPNEFDTSSLLANAFKSKKRVYLPRVISARNHEMTMLEVHSEAELTSWTPNSWGIREPPVDEGRARVPEDEGVDVIVVPGLAFDVHGARCGQGMGFYDTFLRKYAASGRAMPRLVALTLSEQVVNSVPVTDHDWLVDEVLFVKPAEPC